jgi:hypothetical protein
MAFYEVVKRDGGKNLEEGNVLATGKPGRGINLETILLFQQAGVIGP